MAYNQQGAPSSYNDDAQSQPYAAPAQVIPPIQFIPRTQNSSLREFYSREDWSEMFIKDHTSPEFWEAMVSARTDIGAVGKTDKNDYQKWMYRGIDSLLNALSPGLNKHGLSVNVVDTNILWDGLQAPKGGKLTYVTTVELIARWTHQSGAYFYTLSVGTSTDSGDKAMTKALTYAWRTLLSQNAMIPFQEDPDRWTYDTDGTEHGPNETSAKQPVRGGSAAKPPTRAARGTRNAPETNAKAVSESVGTNSTKRVYTPADNANIEAEIKKQVKSEKIATRADLTAHYLKSGKQSILSIYNDDSSKDVLPFINSVYKELGDAFDTANNTQPAAKKQPTQRTKPAMSEPPEIDESFIDNFNPE